MPTEYDALAALYDYEWEELKEDIEFIGAECEKTGSPILELACGTGRITLPIAIRGHEVWGLDNSQEMLSFLKEKRRSLPAELAQRIHIVYGSMENFNFDRQFKSIILPFNSFLLLTSKQQQEQCLQSISKHLVHEGRFVVDIFSPRFELCAQEKSDIRFLKHFYYPPAQQVVIQWEYVERNMAEQVMNIDFLYEIYDSHGSMERLTRSLRMAIIFRFEMQLLLEKNGFEIEEFYGNYDRSPFTKDSPQMIFICRKRG